MYTYNVDMQSKDTLNTYNIHVQCKCTLYMYSVHVECTMYTVFCFIYDAHSTLKGVFVK